MGSMPQLLFNRRDRKRNGKSYPRGKPTANWPGVCGRTLFQQTELSDTWESKHSHGNSTTRSGDVIAAW